MQYELNKIIHGWHVLVFGFIQTFSDPTKRAFCVLLGLEVSIMTDILHKPLSFKELFLWRVRDVPLYRLCNFLNIVQNHWEDCLSHFVKVELLSWKNVSTIQQGVFIILGDWKTPTRKASKKEIKLWQVWSKQIFWQLATEQIEKKN